MSAETSLYRRHRPQSFAEVVGQEHVVRTLRNAIDSGRVHHAYLFVGSRGTGKTSVAKILARSLNCARGPTVDPCGECESCRAIASGSSLDVSEMDAASNRSVNDIRELIERVGYAPAASRWKVYILDEAHMLTPEAWNAFLKTLEEPPPNTVFVLATTEAHKVMETIVDRCQRFDFHRPAPEQIAEVVRRAADAEGIEIDDAAIAAIARSATGSFRDALGTLDQLVSYGGPSVRTDDVLTVLGVADADLLLAAADAIAAGDARGVLEASERLSRSGHDSTQFGRDLLAHLRRLLVVRAVGEVPSTLAATGVEPDRMRSQAAAFTDLGLSRAIDAIAAAIAAIREGDEPRMTLELALLRAARPELDPTSQALAQRLERLEGALAGEPGPAPARPAPVADSPLAPARPAPVPPPQTVAEPAAPARPAAAPERDEAGEAGSSAAPERAGEGSSAPEASAPTAAAPNPAAAPAAAAGPAPVAEAVAATGSVDLERIRELWPAVVGQVRSAGAEVLSHVLEAARPLALDAEEGVVELGFAASDSFHKRKAEAAEARDRVADALRTIIGEKLRPVYVLIDGEHGEEPVKGLGEEELIDLLRDEFDAEEVDAS